MEKNSPWLSIWTTPRKTIKKIVANDPNQSIWGLASILGFLTFFHMAQLFFGKWDPFVLVVSAAVVAPFLGFVLLKIYSWIYELTGKIFKGRGDREDIRAALGWSYVPLALTIPLWILSIFMFNILNHDSSMILLLFLFVLAVWSFVIQVVTIAAVQKFSILQAIGNVILGYIGINIFWFIIAFLIGFFRAFTG
jgi:hypothetical protein